MKSLLFALLLLPAFAAAGTAAHITHKPSSEGHPAPEMLQPGDADFLAARQAFSVGNAVKFERYAARLKDTPLESYLAYYRLRLHMGTANVATIRAFLARPDDTPLTDRMRADWLKWLGKVKLWDLFADEYPRLISEDQELACYAMQEKMRSQREAVLREARNLWMSGAKDMPDNCTPLFVAALKEGAISEADKWQRVRMALESGSVSEARRLSSKLPKKFARDFSLLGSAASSPKHYFAKVKLDKPNDAQRMIALFALQRMAKQHPQLAYAQWKKIEAHFDADEQRYFYGWLGYEAARVQDVQALEWFKQVADGPLTEQQLAWRARAALRAQDWHEVWASITAMTPQQQREGAWRYWKARALKELGRPDDAQALFAGLSSQYSFYGQLAAEELGAAPAAGIMSDSYRPTQEELDAMLARPGVQRTLALYRMDLRTEAATEWAWTVRNMDDKQLLAAAEIARRNEMYDRAIGAAERTVQLHDFNLRYLAPYREVLRGHIAKNGLEEAWVYGLMRQESRFLVRAKSEVGAAGLMQLMPTTARWVAQQLGMKHYRRSQIHLADTNFTLGTYYMKTVLTGLDNNPVLASAAYNAGGGRARQWRGDAPLEGAIYAETIPFDETRDYVKKVMSNTVYYAKLFGQPTLSLKQRLGVIAPREIKKETRNKPSQRLTKIAKS